MVIFSDQPDVPLPNENIWNFLRPSFEKFAKLTALAIESTGESATVEQLMIRSLRWAKVLKEHFVGSKAPKVLIMIKDCIDYPPLVIGSFAVGATACPILADATDDFTAHVVSIVNPDIFVIDSNLKSKMDIIISNLNIQPKIYCHGPCEHAEGDVAEILKFGIPLDQADAGQYDPSSIGLIAFSSGTTGKPKAIVFANNDFLNGVKLYCQSRSFPIHCSTDESEQQDVIAGFFPLGHVFAIAHHCIINIMFGIKFLSIRYKTADDVLGCVNKYQPDLLYLRPHILEELSKLDDVSKLNNLRSMMIVGSPCNIEAMEKLQEKANKSFILQDCYGLTECFAIAVNTVADQNYKKGLKVLPNRRVKFVDITSGKEITEPNERGELLVKGPGMMTCYQNNLKATEDLIDSDGWYHTGDIGSFDEENYIRVFDRKVDIICVGSQKFLPSVLEALIKQHHSVKDVGILETADTDVTRGAKIVAFVVPHDMQSQSLNIETEIMKFVELNAPFPEMRLTGGVKIVPSLPRSPFGKLIRKQLRELSWYARNF